MNALVIQSQEELVLPNYLLGSTTQVQQIDLEAAISQDDNLDYDTLLDKILVDNAKFFSLSDIVIIRHVGDNSDGFAGLRLIHHIRLSKKYRHMPIILTGDKNFKDLIIDVSSYGYSELTLILNTGGVTYHTENELNCRLIDYLATDLKASLPAKENYQTLFLSQIVVKEPEEQYGRHGIANEWGAYRLAQVAGILPSNTGGSEIQFAYPKTLYFKYLLAFQNEQDQIPSKTKSFWAKDLNVLYIDDNEHRSWSKCLGLVLNNKIISNGKATITSRKAWDNGLESDIESDKFDLIFLDYYLSDGIKGDSILSDIKSLNPVTPVIMFTASNKAWNMDKLYEAGADGYYVKEHPETAQDWTFSVDNFDAFYNTIRKCLEKGKLLRPYWRKIQEIKHCSIIHNRPGEVVRERINERLYMFLGLLKKSFEETKFDKNTFFYSDIELAFLTLWSSLNEIQHAFFNKRLLIYTDNAGNTYTEHVRRNETPKPSLPIRHDWTLNLPLPFVPFYSNFVEYTPSFRYDLTGSIKDKNGFFELDLNQKSILHFDGSNRSGRYYSFNRKGVVPIAKNLEQILHSQIAFILLNMSSNLHLLTWLKELNDTRNKLYLTHGEDTSTDYNSEIRNQRVHDLDVKCKQLFEIVFFLTTGSQCTW